MHSTRFAMPASFLLVGLLAVAAGFGSSDSASGVIHLKPPPPVGVALVVNTTSDLVDPGNGTCSLRAAISAANINGKAGNCDATGSQAGATDAIGFAIRGTPTINVGSVLPTITDRVSIDGTSGGATRVVLHGPGTHAANGLAIASGGIYSSVRGLIVNNFIAGITLQTDATVAGNYFGTDETGTVAVPNGVGVYLTGSLTQNTVIGGLNNGGVGGTCTGDCNLISGNSTGIAFEQSTVALIEGNFIGTDVTGSYAVGNTDAGILLRDGTKGVAIGAAMSGAGNLISGNLRGIEIFDGVAPATTTIRGNRVGTNTSGTSAVPNGTGINIESFGSANPFTIGGIEAGAGNLISGNTYDGLDLDGSSLTVYQNMIGTQIDGTSPMPNGHDGIHLFSFDDHDLIGGTASAEANVIAFNGRDGVSIDDRASGDGIRGNSIHDNSSMGIFLLDDQNFSTVTPSITGVNPIEGTACANCIVDVYSDAGSQGGAYEGSVAADNAGNWIYNGSPGGPNITATATSANGSTSEFAAPMTLPATPTPSPSPTPTASPTAMPTFAGTPTQSTTPTPIATPSAPATSSPRPTASDNVVLGDANCDGKLDLKDVLAMLSDLGGVPPGSPCADRADVNCNNRLDADDAVRLLAFQAGAPLPQLTNCGSLG